MVPLLSLASVSVPAPQADEQSGCPVDILAREHVAFINEITIHRSPVFTRFDIGDDSRFNPPPRITASTTLEPLLPIYTTFSPIFGPPIGSSSINEPFSDSQPQATVTVEASVTRPRHISTPSSTDMEVQPTVDPQSTAVESPTTVTSIQTQSAAKGNNSITVTNVVSSTTYPPTGHGLATGTIVGISGGAVAIILGICALFFLALRWRRRRSHQDIPIPREDDDSGRDPASHCDVRASIAVCPPLLEMLTDLQSPLSEKAARGYRSASPSASNLADRVESLQPDVSRHDRLVQGAHVEDGVRRHATDAGVRLAGGRPGSAVRDEESDEDETCTLPPSYSEIRYSQ